MQPLNRLLPYWTTRQLCWRQPLCKKLLAWTLASELNWAAGQEPALSASNGLLSAACLLPSGRNGTVMICVLDGLLRRKVASTEVHIYDTASGNCMHSVELPNQVQASWSSSRDLLGVCCKQVDGWVNWTGSVWIPEYESGLRYCTMQVINPVVQQVATMHCESLSRGGVWQGFDWTPCGNLLIAKYQDDERRQLQGLCISDPCSADLVCWFDIQDLIWGPLSSPERAFTAFGPAKCCMIRFSHDLTGWRPEVTGMREAGVSFDTAISPCGSTLVLLGKSGLTGPYMRLYHYALATQSQHTIASVPQWQRCIDMGWAPFARAWLQVYAYVGCQLARRTLPNDVGSTVGASVDLNDAASHKFLASWKAQALTGKAGQWAEAPFQDVPRAVKWAPHGRHLAILCSNSVLVMTFGSTGA